MILVSILLGIPVGCFYIVLMRSTRFFVKVCVLEICTLAYTYKYTNTHAHTHRNTLVCVRGVTRTLSHKFRHFLHSYTNANKPAQTHVHEHIYLYKYSYWIIFMRLTSIFMPVSIFILKTCEYIHLLNMLLCRLSYFGGFNWFQSFSFVHFCRLSSFPWAFSFFCAALSSLPKLPTRYVNLCTNL